MTNLTNLTNLTDYDKKDLYWETFKKQTKFIFTKNKIELLYERIGKKHFITIKGQPKVAYGNTPFECLSDVSEEIINKLNICKDSIETMRKNKANESMLIQFLVDYKCKIKLIGNLGAY